MLNLKGSGRFFLVGILLVIIIQILEFILMNGLTYFLLKGGFIMSLIKFNNGSNNKGLNPGFNDLFESVFNDSFLSDRMITRVPAVNICETQDHYLIEMAAPGLNKEEFNIKLDRNLLTVSVEQNKDQSEQNRIYNKREFSYNSFVRSFALPDTADDAQIEAKYMDGMLNIHVAKKDEAKQIVRQIEIK